MPDPDDIDEILAALRERSKVRGERAALAHALHVSQSTVKRWVDGTCVPPKVIRGMLAWYLFGSPLPTVAERNDEMRGILRMSAREWAQVQRMANRQGVEVDQFIAERIRAILAWEMKITNP